jgi:hypothetical protein
MGETLDKFREDMENDPRLKADVEFISEHGSDAIEYKPMTRKELREHMLKTRKIADQAERHYEDSYCDAESMFVIMYERGEDGEPFYQGCAGTLEEAMKYIKKDASEYNEDDMVVYEYVKGEKLPVHAYIVDAQGTDWRDATQEEVFYALYFSGRLKWATKPWKHGIEGAALQWMHQNRESIEF